MTRRRRIVVTTSWDDGHGHDNPLADLLDNSAVRSTFYIAPRSGDIDEDERLTPNQIRHLATRFEIGGHTLTHRRLTAFDALTAEREIVDGKNEFEHVIGTAVASFCYPGGEYDASHVELVRLAGFRVARSVKRFVTTASTDLLQLGTSVHAYRHLVDLPMRHRPLRNPRKAISYWRNWDDLAIALFERTRRRGGVCHLWGHSWEVSARGDRPRLERVLRDAGGRPDVSYVTNGQLASIVGGGPVG